MCLRLPLPLPLSALALRCSSEYSWTILNSLRRRSCRSLSSLAGAITVVVGLGLSASGIESCCSTKCMLRVVCRCPGSRFEGALPPVAPLHRGVSCSSGLSASRFGRWRRRWLTRLLHPVLPLCCMSSCYCWLHHRAAPASCPYWPQVLAALRSGVRSCDF